MTKQIIVIMTLSSILSFLGCKSKPEKTTEEIEMDKAFEEWNNRPIYKVLTTEILDKISDDMLEQTVFDNIYEIIGDDYKNELKNIQGLSPGQQAFWSTWVLEGEVNNGGFNQFYFNSSGQYSKMAEVGFKTIGAEKFADLTIRANNIYNENKERLEEFDDGTMESFSESYKDNPLNELDTEFYALGETESISGLRIKYIRDHVSEFTTD
ncbi:DMP19 family protein [Flavobacteriaceae bacterium 3-367]